MTPWRFVVLLLFLVPTSADAAWDRVKSYLQPEVEIVQEDEDRLELRHPQIPATLVLTREFEEGAHIFGTLLRNRQGNPYRVWVATAEFWDHPQLPRSRWGRFLRADFLGIVRRPDSPIARSHRVAR